MKSNKRKHYDFLDVSRGFAILLMFIFHFCYDLDYFGYIDQDFTHDPFWTSFRNLIVSLFLLIMGTSLYLANYRGIRKSRYNRRLAQLVLYAALVSLGSWLMFPKAMIFFGILHFIALASVVGLLFLRFGIVNLILGIALIIFSLNFSHPFFNQPWLQWFGLVSRLPVTVDYVPFLPWFGVVLIGIYLGDRLTRLPEKHILHRWQSRDGFTRLLRLGGLHSLNIYMLHQPVFIGLLYLVHQLSG